jgi:hypothetical protein
MFLLLGLKFLEIIVQPVEAGVAEAATSFKPVVDVLEGGRLDPARPLLRLAPGRDETGALQRLEVLRDSGQAHREGPGQLGHRCFAQGEPCGRAASDRRERREWC